MTTFTDRLLMILETQTKGLASLNQTESALKKTDKAATATTKSTGKLGSAFDLLKGSGALAGIGVASVATVALKSLDAFEKLGKTAVDMAASLGVTTEEASRWVAVADDYQVSAEQISKALLMVERDAAGAGTKIAATGGEVKRLADGSVDVTGTMESVADGLRGIQDPAERAAAGADLFKKGWAAVAPIMTKSGAAIDKAMQSVSDGQVITADEAESAERMRLAQDALGDAVGDLERALGELLAQFAPVITLVADGVEWFLKIQDAVGDFEKKLGPLGKALGILTNPLGAGAGLLDLFGGKAKDAKKPVDDLGGSMDDAADAATAMDDAYRLLLGALDSQSALLRATGQFDDLRDATAAAHHAGVVGTAASIEANRKMQASVIETKQDVIRYAQSLGNIPPEKVTEILALIDHGDYMNALHQMNTLAADRTATVNVQLRGLEKLLNLGGLFHTPGFPTAAASSSSSVAAAASRSPAALGAAPSIAATLTVPAAAVVINLNAAVLGNPAHISDAVVAGYRRATRVSGPRAIGVPA